jgi:hypothetical protein
MKLPSITENLTPDELWQYAVKALDAGDFSRLEKLLGGPSGFDAQIVNWYDAGHFENEPDALAEALTCACMLGRTATARYLLDKGIDPYAGMKTWLAGPHYAVSSGHIETVKMLIEKNVPLEVANLYGGTMLGQALWSAVNEHQDSHAPIIETLIEAGAEIELGTLEWWEKQDVPSSETKQRVSAALRNARAS